jgi:hypothetical protein
MTQGGGVLPCPRTAAHTHTHTHTHAHIHRCLALPRRQGLHDGRVAALPQPVSASCATAAAAGAGRAACSTRRAGAPGARHAVVAHVCPTASHTVATQGAGCARCCLVPAAASAPCPAPLPLSPPPPPTPVLCSLHDAFFAAASEAGLKANPDFNAWDHSQVRSRDGGAVCNTLPRRPGRVCVGGGGSNNGAGRGAGVSLLGALVP